MALVIDNRPAFFEEPDSSFSDFDFTEQPIPLEFNLSVVDPIPSTSFTIDRELVDTFSEISIGKFGVGFLGPILQSEYDTTVVDASVTVATSRSLTNTYSPIPINTFGERYVFTRLNTRAMSTVGEVWTSKIATAMSDLATLETVATAYAEQNVMVGKVVQSLAKSNLGAFGTGSYDDVKSTATPLDPNLSYVTNAIVIETTKAFGFVGSNTGAIPVTGTSFVSNAAYAVTSKTGLTKNAVFLAIGRRMYARSSAGAIATSRYSLSKHNIRAATSKMALSSHKAQAYEGATVFTLSNAIAVVGSRKFTKNGVVFGKQLRRFSVNNVISGNSGLDFVTNNAIMKVGPTLSTTRNTVLVQNANSTLVNGSQLDNSLSQDPLLNQYVNGFN